MKHGGVLLGLICFGVASVAFADAPPSEARLECRRVAGPGRVLCELEVEVDHGRLAWADALVTRAPDFASPLRSRVGPMAAAGGTARRLRLPVALAATRIGRGELGVTARFVRCVTVAGSAREVCTPLQVPVRATVEVGPEQGTH
jgi:hypothetical protein